MKVNIRDKRRTATGAVGLRYVLPVIIENSIGIVGTFIFSAISGKISISSLTAIGIINSLITFLVASLSMVTIGSAILTSRFVGARDKELTTKAIEQSLFLTVVIAVTIAALVLVFSKGICNLLVQSDDAVLVSETLVYMRLLSVSLPFFVLYSVFCAIMRAADNSKFPMLVSFIMNGLLIILAYVFIVPCNMGVMGSGLAVLISRIVACVISSGAVFSERILYKIDILRILKPDKEMVSTIVKLGLPTTVESLCVQGAYLVVNSMIVSIGTHEAAVYAVTTSIYQIAAVFHTIFSALTVTYVGHHIGAKRYKEAKVCAFKIMLTGVLIITAFSGLIVLVRDIIVPLLSNEAAVINDAKNMLWVIIITGIAGMPLNTNDMAMRTGGDTKCVMLYTSLIAWLVRLPLTYLFCFALDWGALGAFIANFISLFLRSIFAIARNLGNKWIHIKV